MKVNEIFYSIQGEGYHSGTSAVFVRFSGCNLRCDFCDTEHQRGREISEDDIIQEICKYPAKHIVLTGGEPSLQITEEFINKLHKKGKYIQIETNGTNKLPYNIDWITCSPKSSGKIVVVNPHELKVVYTGQDLTAFEELSAGYHYLQPCSCSNTDKVIDYIKKHPKWKLSLQTQKILNIR